MENNEVESMVKAAENPPITPVTNPAVVQPINVFRPNSYCGIIEGILRGMEGEYNVHDVVNKYNEVMVKNNEQPGNAIRNVRLVVTALLKNGILVKVSRGRWKKV